MILMMKTAGLTEVLNHHGAELQSQAETLLSGAGGQPADLEWERGGLKRAMPSIGLLTGSGVLGGAGDIYHRGRHRSDGQAGNATQPGAVTIALQPFMPEMVSDGVLEDSFGNHALHHDDPPLVSITTSLPQAETPSNPVTVATQNRGVIRGISGAGENGLASVGRNILSEVSLPTTRELAVLGKTTLSAMDPGFELLSGLGGAGRARP